MKTLLKSLLVSCLAVVLALGVALSASAAQITLNSVIAHPPNHPVSVVYLEVLKSIQERADREIPGTLRINHRGGTEVTGRAGHRGGPPRLAARARHPSPVAAGHGG